MSFPPANSNGAAAPTAAAGVRCVLVHPHGQAVPGELLTSLSRRVKHISVCSDSFAAMAEVCAAAERPSPTPSLILLLVQPDQIPDAEELLRVLPTYAPDVVFWKFDSRANPKLAPCVGITGIAPMARGGPAAVGAEVASRPPPVDSMKDRHPSPSGEQTGPASSAPTPRLSSVSSVDSAPVAPSPAPSRQYPVVRVASTRTTAPLPAGTNGAKRSAGSVGSATPEGPGRMVLTPEELRMLLGDDPQESRS